MIEMSVQTRTYFVLGVMFACFAILYPKIFHPMILSALGWNRPVQSSHEYMSHPRDRMLHRPGGPGPGAGGPGRPHPGMRMGGEATSTRTGGGRGGIMGMVLPIYAVGIVLYLIYTLVKVFGGGSNSNEKNKERKEAILREYYRNFHYDPDKGKFRLGRGSDDDEHSDEEMVGSDGRRPRRNGAGGRNNSGATPNASGASRRSLPRDLERLLRKVDDKNITETEMRELRDRLEETERQMTRILEAMKEVQQRVEPDDSGQGELDEERCECATYETGESADGETDVVENLGSAQLEQQPELRRRKGEARSQKRRNAREGDSTESEDEEFMDLDDGYEAEAEERDDEEFRPRLSESVNKYKDDSSGSDSVPKASSGKDRSKK